MAEGLTQRVVPTPCCDGHCPSCGCCLCPSCGGDEDCAAGTEWCGCRTRAILSGWVGYREMSA